LGKLTGECKNLSDFLKNNNIDYNGMISECEMKDKKIINLIFKDSDNSISQKIIDEIGNKYRNLKKLEIHGCFKKNVNFDSIRHLLKLTSLMIVHNYSRCDFSRIKTRDEFFPTGICKAENLKEM